MSTTIDMDIKESTTSLCDDIHALCSEMCSSELTDKQNIGRNSG